MPADVQKFGYRAFKEYEKEKRQSQNVITQPKCHSKHREEFKYTQKKKVDVSFDTSTFFFYSLV